MGAKHSIPRLSAARPASSQAGTGYHHRYDDHRQPATVHSMPHRLCALPPRSGQASQGGDEISDSSRAPRRSALQRSAARRAGLPRGGRPDDLPCSTVEAKFGQVWLPCPPPTPTPLPSAARRTGFGMRPHLGRGDDRVGLVQQGRGIDEAWNRPREAGAREACSLGRGAWSPCRTRSAGCQLARLSARPAPQLPRDR